MKHPNILVLSLVFLLSGCAITGESPPTQFYILPSLTSKVIPIQSFKHVIGVRPIVLPLYLDRPQIVTIMGEGKIKLADLHRWAEPLSAGINRVITAGLTARLPNSHIASAPVHHLHPDRLLQIKIHELQVDKSECRIKADWRLSQDNQTLAWHQEAIHLPLSSPTDYDGIVQTMGQAIDVLASRIVEKLPIE